MKIESIEIHNYKALRDVKVNNIGGFAVFLGGNGAGKSTLFDVFRFLQESLASGIAQPVQMRGGLEKLRTYGCNENIAMELIFSLNDSESYSYQLAFGEDENREVCIVYESLKDKNSDKFIFSRKKDSQVVFTDDEFGLGLSVPPNFAIAKKDALALSIMGQLQNQNEAIAIRDFLAQIFLFTFENERDVLSLNFKKGDKLQADGSNLPSLAYDFIQNHPDKFKRIIDRMKHEIAGLKDVSVALEGGVRIKLAFHDGSFQDSFNLLQISDGTLKLFALLILLENPDPPPLIIIEEPEKDIYQHSLAILAEFFAIYCVKTGKQAFVSTHSSDFISSLEPTEVFMLKKGKQSYTNVFEIGKSILINNFVNSGEHLDSLWRDGSFELENGDNN
ncbi:MAG: AAA family ATPase [Spirochaetaceae bacterium]|jgi:predicted ATPase|nr:AAA family ATPase [Spirochaetaceae bacterium]